MIPAVCGGIVFASPYILHEILKVDERMNQTAEVTVEPLVENFTAEFREIFEFKLFNF